MGGIPYYIKTLCRLWVASIKEFFNAPVQDILYCIMQRTLYTYICPHMIYKEQCFLH
jgi:hypothetical protein